MLLVSLGFGNRLLLLVFSGGEDAVHGLATLSIIGSLILGDLVHGIFAVVANSFDELD